MHTYEWHRRTLVCLAQSKYRPGPPSDHRTNPPLTPSIIPALADPIDNATSCRLSPARPETPPQNRSTRRARKDAQAIFGGRTRAGRTENRSNADPAQPANLHPALPPKQDETKGGSDPGTRIADAPASCEPTRPPTRMNMFTMHDHAMTCAAPPQVQVSRRQGTHGRPSTQR